MEAMRKGCGRHETAAPGVERDSYLLELGSEAIRVEDRLVSALSEKRRHGVGSIAAENRRAVSRRPGLAGLAEKDGRLVEARCLVAESGHLGRKGGTAQAFSARGSRPARVVGPTDILGIRSGISVAEGEHVVHTDVVPTARAAICRNRREPIRHVHVRRSEHGGKEGRHSWFEAVAKRYMTRSGSTRRHPAIGGKCSRCPAVAFLAARSRRSP